MNEEELVAVTALAGALAADVAAFAVLEKILIEKKILDGPITREQGINHFLETGNIPMADYLRGN